MAPGLAAALSRDRVTVGRATHGPRNPKNEAAGWQADALAELERMQAEHVPLAGKGFARRLPDGRIAYPEPPGTGPVGSRRRGCYQELPRGFSRKAKALAYAEPLVNRSCA